VEITSNDEAKHIVFKSGLEAMIDSQILRKKKYRLVDALVFDANQQSWFHPDMTGECSHAPGSG
jgi:hypothetical protein